MMIKPPYKVPSMTEIRSIPWNGYNVVSTFSGGGGSCLGYRMAGYRVIWANEFIPAAQETYRANHPHSILDKRDIRLITPQDILDATGLKVGEIDIFDGSPPCAAFSTAGKREKGWGKVKNYSDSSQVVDDLFFEYARLIKGTHPKVFVAENVAGLIKGTAKGYFLQILKSLKDCGYRVKCKVLDAQWLGVPQSRTRTIFVGVRNDLNLDPVHPSPLAYRYNLGDAIINCEPSESRPLVKGKSKLLWEHATPDIGGRFAEAHRRLYGKNMYFTHHRGVMNEPAHTILQNMSMYHPFEPRTLSVNEVKRVCSFPDDFILIGSLQKKWERMGRAVPPVMMSHVAKTIQLEILSKCVD